MPIETAIAIIEKVTSNRSTGRSFLSMSEYASVNSKVDALDHIFENYQIDGDHEQYLAVVEINTLSGATRTLADRTEIVRHLDDRDDKAAQRTDAERSHTERNFIGRVTRAEHEYKSR